MELEFPDHAPLHVIEPGTGWPLPHLRELWDYRDLAYFLAWREIKVRYKQTVLGVAWAVVQPVMTMVVFSVFFGRLGGMPSDGLPYPIFAYSALLPWQLFAFALTESSNSIVANQHLITKVYFPRLITPIAAISVGLVDFLVSMVVLGLLMAFYGIAPTAALWTIPIWTLFAVVTAFSVGLWLATLNVRFRDVRYTLPFLTQLWLFASPVAYSVSLVPEQWRSLYALNPMVGVIEGFRWALLGQREPLPLTVMVSAVAVCVLLVTGLIYFRRMERTFADVI
jgi:lipopolysaccharide transport system permease protein